MPVSIMFRKEHRDEHLHDSSGDGGPRFGPSEEPVPPPGRLGSECSGAGVATGWGGRVAAMADDSDRLALSARLKGT